MSSSEGDAETSHGSREPRPDQADFILNDLHFYAKVSERLDKRIEAFKKREYGGTASDRISVDFKAAKPPGLGQKGHWVQVGRQVSLVQDNESGKPLASEGVEIRPSPIKVFLRAAPPSVQAPSVAINPLAFGRFLVPRRHRATIDLIRLDLREDAQEMLLLGYSKRRVQRIIRWHSWTSLAPFLWRGVRNLLPFKKLGWEDDPKSAQ